MGQREVLTVHKFSVLSCFNAKVLFLFNSIDPFVCRLTAASVFQAMLLRQEISFVK